MTRFVRTASFTLAALAVATMPLAVEAKPDKGKQGDVKVKIKGSDKAHKAKKAKPKAHKAKAPKPPKPKDHKVKAEKPKDQKFKLDTGDQKVKLDIKKDGDIKYEAKRKSDGVDHKVKVESKDGKLKVEEKLKIKDAASAAGVAALGAGFLTGSDALAAEVAARLVCPPGLAKRNPPCVPPGQAKKGVTTEEWTGHTREEYRRILRENDDVVEDVEVEIDEDRYLTEAEIIDIFDLEPAGDGFRYAVIDGQIVRLDDEDYLLLQQLRTIALPPGVAADLVIEPTVALSEQELVSIYNLPQPAPDSHYAVVDGTVVMLGTEGYDLLQLIRLTSAVVS